MKLHSLLPTGEWAEVMSGVGFKDRVRGGLLVVVDWTAGGMCGWVLLELWSSGAVGTGQFAAVGAVAAAVAALRTALFIGFARPRCRQEPGTRVRELCGRLGQ